MKNECVQITDSVAAIYVKLHDLDPDQPEMKISSPSLLIHNYYEIEFQTERLLTYDFFNLILESTIRAGTEQFECSPLQKSITYRTMLMASTSSI